MEILLPILLIVVGLALFAAEVYLVPGFNIFGLLGFGLLGYGIFQIFMEIGLAGGLLALALTALTGVLLFYVMWTNGAWDRFVLETNLKADPALRAREKEQRSQYLGKAGAAVTSMRPTGIVEVDGVRLEAQTEGEYIAAGSDVKVVAMDRRRYFVRLANVAPPVEKVEGKDRGHLQH